MWHLLYIVAFAALATLAITNLVRNLMMLGTTARQQPNAFGSGQGSSGTNASRPVPHPELLDEDGNVIREPLLVMRSISVSDARDRLNALYEGMPLPTPEPKLDDTDDLDQD